MSYDYPKQEDKRKIISKLNELGFKIMEGNYSSVWSNERYFEIQFYSQNNRNYKFSIGIIGKQSFSFEGREDKIDYVSESYKERKFTRKLEFETFEDIDWEKFKDKIEEVKNHAKLREKRLLENKIEEVKYENEEKRREEIIEKEFGFLKVKESNYSDDKIFKLNKKEYDISVSDNSDSLFGICMGGVCHRNNLTKKQVLEFLTELKRIVNFLDSDKLLMEENNTLG